MHLDIRGKLTVTHATADDILKPLLSQTYHKLTCDWFQQTETWCTAVLKAPATFSGATHDSRLYEALNMFMKKTVLGTAGTNILMATIVLRYIIKVCFSSQDLCMSGMRPDLELGRNEREGIE